MSGLPDGSPSPPEIVPRSTSAPAIPPRRPTPSTLPTPSSSRIPIPPSSQPVAAPQASQPVTTPQVSQPVAAPQPSQPVATPQASQPGAPLPPGAPSQTTAQPTAQLPTKPLPTSIPPAAAIPLPKVSTPSPVDIRSALLKDVLPSHPQLEDVISHVAKGTAVPSTAPQDLVQKAVLVNKIADLFDNNEVALKAVIADPKIQTLRDVALNTDLDAVAATVRPASIVNGAVATPASTPPAKSTAATKPLDVHLAKTRLFHAEPTAVIQKMVADGKINLHPNVKSAVVSFLDSQPSFNIRQKSITTALNQPGALQGVPTATVPEVKQTLKNLQRVQALAATPDAVPTLVNSGISSAYQVSQIPQAHFVRSFSKIVGSDAAAQIHSHASTVTQRNDQALLQIFQTIKGAGVAAIDGSENLDTRSADFRKVVETNNLQINLETLFGGMDYCDCPDCLSVTSPTNYFVDLLQYLRSNTLDASVDPSTNAPLYPGTGKATIQGTALEVLLKRRPDIKHLQLTCDNANTLIPYIDLVNEVLESFLVHLHSYPSTWTPDSQDKIDVFNVDGEASSELLSEPQHTNYKAYCILHEQVYPLGSSPFHQPIAAIRIYLNYLKTSRTEVLDIFRKPYVTPVASPPFSTHDDAKLSALHDETISRAVSAEFLGIIQEEYIDLTKEAFWPISYFEVVTRRPSISKHYYQKHIGARHPWEYWGYDNETDFLSDDPTALIGLLWVKAQFLTRAGMQYTDVVNLIKTNFVNPVYPTGRDLIIMQSIRFSYRFLRTLVDHTARCKRDRFKKVIKFLEIMQPDVYQYIASHSVDQGDQADPLLCLSKSEICEFVYKWFDCLAKIIVLESGEGPTLPIYGLVVLDPPPTQTPSVGGNINPKIAALASTASVQIKATVSPAPSRTVIGTLYPDGTITDNKTFPTDAADLGSLTPKVGNVIGTVAVESNIYTPTGDKFADQYQNQGTLNILSKHVSIPPPPTTTTELAAVEKMAVQHHLVNQARIYPDSSLHWIQDGGDAGTVRWNAVVDSCNIDTVRIMHLDGTELKSKEWDEINRFVRLWKRLGWTIDETDKALAGLGQVKPASSGSGLPNGTMTTPSTGSGLTPDPIVHFWDFTDDDCTSGKCGGAKGGCPKCGRRNKKEHCSCGRPKDECECCPSRKPHETGCHCEDPKKAIYPGAEDRGKITPQFLQELVSVKKLQTATSIDLIKLLALWADISTFGDNSLYASLFLTHNIIGVDPVFQADNNGNYLAATTTIADHITVIRTALRLRPDDLNAILAFANLASANLTLDTISTIYRYALLAQSLAIKPALLIEAIQLLGDPFKDADATLDFVNIYQKVSAAGFSIQQLTYVISGTDDPIKPVGPNFPTILKTAKSLFDGLNAIDTTHPNLLAGTIIDNTLVTTNASLVFDQSTAAEIDTFLAGTMTYNLNAPAGLGITIPATLSAKLLYTDAPAGATGSAKTGSLTVTGILTADETVAAKALSSNAGWAGALDRAAKRALTFYTNYLSSVFPNQTEAQGVLLAGDVIVAADKVDPTKPDPNTAPVKRAYFMQYFLPFLRQQLENQLVINTMAGEAGLSSNDITSALLTGILTFPNSDPTVSTTMTGLNILRGLKNPPASAASGVWTGYLTPQVTDQYTFVGFGDTLPGPLTINGVSVPFVQQQADPNNVWFTNPFPLVGGKVYTFNAGGQSVPGLQWETARSPPVNIPSSALLPDYSTGAADSVFVKLAKAAIMINGFSFTLDEINYLQGHQADFGGFNLDAVTLPGWKRALAYFNLKGSLPKMQADLIDLFKWASGLSSSSTPTATDIATKVNAVTNWAVTDVQTLIGPNCLNLSSPSLYVNEIALYKLQKAITVIGKVQVPIASLFKWSDPLAKFWPTHAIAMDVRNTIRAKYSVSDWEQAAKPLHDNLRMQQRDALVPFLVLQKPLVEWGVVDADSLFEFFLIDVQMGACLQTSRIKQAISTVQLFVQRCILGLEEEKYPTIKNNSLDQVRWQWMSKQTLWTANRKVFLYPENYLVGSLRDDKTPEYITLETDLKQKSTDAQAVQDEIKEYFYGLDRIANLMVQGIYQDDNDPAGTIYFVGKTRSAPYLFFTRTVSKTGWTPWQSLPVDIPNYHVDQYVIITNTVTSPIVPFPPEFSVTTYPACDGSYVTPVVLDGRFLVFFGQLTLKSIPQPSAGDLTLTEGTKASDVQRFQSWEIKLGWTEYRNGKWSPKKLTVDGIMETPVSPTPPNMDQYRFVPQIVSQQIQSGTQTVSVRYVSIAVYNQANSLVGGFEFHGSQVFALDQTAFTASTTATGAFNTFSWSTTTRFHFTIGNLASTNSSGVTTAAVPSTIYSLQAGSTFTPTSRPYVQYPLDAPSTSNYVDATGNKIPFYHKFSHQLLSIASSSTKLSDIYATYGNQPLSDQPQEYGQSGTDSEPSGTYLEYNELSTPYAIYNWEIGFHAPLELADNLLQSNLFDDALNMCQLVFNPYADGADASRVWQWGPFTNVNTVNVLEGIFNALQANEPDNSPGQQIDAWRNNPFAPHVVARDRPVAYMKWTVMKYLQILIAYGDYYFRQNSLETVPLAIQYYVLASHIYGQRAQKIPTRGKVRPQSYYSLLDKWDAFSNAVVDLELAFPFSNQIAQPVEFSGNDMVLANIFGFATTHYFNIPNNPQLLALRDLIDDRLYKIRHCEDINGNPVSLALWDPPLDPAALVAAVAAGASLSSFLNDLNSPMPNYRFYYLLQKAFELVGELKSMMSQFLSVKEKRDAEALQLLKQMQDNVIQTLIMEVRTLQLDEANKSLDALSISRNGPLARYTYYTSLAGATAAGLAETDTDYSELSLNLPPPTNTGDLVLTDNEQQEMNEAKAANDWGEAIGALEVLAGVCFAFPKIGEKAEPWGLGVSLSMGPSNIGQSAQANARAFRIIADNHTFNSTNAGRKATYIKQYQDRIFQANSAGHELLNINYQMTTQASRIAAANQEITNQQQQIDNSAELLDFLGSKYTNDALYGFLEDSLRTVAYQTYTMAYDIAKKAEAAYIFERGGQPGSFIQFGYWNTARDGLQSGEQLWVALKKLETAYQDNRGYDFEVVKPISLRQLDPYALLQFRETGTCQVEIPEIIFDMDFPGHYFRKIKSVTLTIPAVVGPFTTINCTLRLLSHSYRVDPTAADANSYAQDNSNGLDPRFQTSSVPISSVAVSSGQNDCGTFELNLKDERYLPFEGAGTISQWQLDLPTAVRQFDYDSISDVILSVRYTSQDGGDKLRTTATSAVAAYIKAVEDDTQGLYALFDLRSDFASEWARAVGPLPTPAAGTAAQPRTITLKDLANRLPGITRGRDPSKVLAQDITLLTTTPLQASAYTLDITSGATAGAQDNTVTFDGKDAVGALNVMGASGVGLGFAGTWTLSIQADPTVRLQKIWLIVRFILT